MTQAGARFHWLMGGNLFGIDSRGLGARRHGSQHVLLTHDQRGGVIARQLETMAMSDGIGGTSLDAIPTENAAVVVDVVNRGVAFAARDAHLLGILGGFDINTVSGAG